MTAASPAEDPVRRWTAPARKALEKVSPYRPGKPVAEVQRELGLAKVVKLASNENPLGASPRAMAAYRASLKRTAFYPEGSSPLLRAALERRLGVGKGSVVVGNGSDEVMRLLCETLLEDGDEAVVSRFGFIRYRQCVEMMGARAVEVPEKNLRHDLQAMAAAVGPRTKLLFVASPNNPTGSYSTADEVDQLLRSVPDRVVVVLDEAYYEYATPRADYPQSLPALARRTPNLAVLRTFSKAYGLAGLRVGFGVMHPDLASSVDRIRMPFNVALPAQEAALAALEDEDFVGRSVALVERERPRLAERLSRLGLKVFPSAANFVLVETPGTGRTLFERLLRQGVIVRPLDEYGLTRHLRVSVGSPRQNSLLVASMKRALKEDK